MIDLGHIIRIAEAGLFLGMIVPAGKDIEAVSRVIGQ